MFWKTWAITTAVALLALAPASSTQAQSPKHGGMLKFAVVAEPPSTDCHAVSTFAFVHPGRPHYSTLLKYSGNFDSMKIVGDLAKSWEVAADGLAYTFHLHENVSFHDGSILTADDVKASYERIIRPPEGVISVRRSLHSDIATIETPDPLTVVFRMGQPNASMLTHFASPWNCIYSAAKLKEDQHYPEKTIMGTGPFRFVSYVKGQHWEGKRFENYFRKDHPYLDGYKAFFVKSSAVVPGMLGGQFDAEFRGRTPKERDQLLTGMKDNAQVIEGPWITSIIFTLNATRKPFDDARVRRALTLAIDRHAASTALSQISTLKYVGGLTRPGFDFNLEPDDLAKMPGFGRDIGAARAEAKRLLAEAGVSNLKIKLVNRNVSEPYTPAAVYVIDQWRRIGVETEHTQLETTPFFDAMANGNFDVLVEFVSDFADDPSAQFDKFLTKQKSSQASSGHTDKRFDELFDKQARTIDVAERRKLSREFERLALTEAYSTPLLWWQRIIVLHKKIKGWEHQADRFYRPRLG